MSDLRPPRYLKSMNKFVIGLQKLGIRTGPAMVLTVPGRKTGQPRSTPMTPFEHRGGCTPSRGIPAPTGQPTPALPAPGRSPAAANRAGSRSSK